MQVSLIGAHGPQIISRLHPLVGAHIQIYLVSGADFGIEVFCHSNPARKLSVCRQKSIEAQWRMEGDGWLLDVWNNEVARIHRVTTHFDFRDRHLAAGIDN